MNGRGLTDGTRKGYQDTQGERKREREGLTVGTSFEENTTQRQHNNKTTKHTHNNKEANVATNLKP